MSPYQLHKRFSPLLCSVRFQAVIGLATFAIAYVWLNWQVILIDVGKSWSAGSTAEALCNGLYYLLQSTVLLLVLALAPRLVLTFLLITIGFSATVNSAYEALLQAPLDSSALSWLWGERHQFSAAAIEYPSGFAWAVFKAICLVMLLMLTRQLVKPWRGKLAIRWRFLWAVVLFAYVALDPWLLLMGGYRRGAEANIFAQAIAVLASSKPARQPVDIPARSNGEIRKIVWLIDESISWRYFERYIKPHIPPALGIIDFGDTSSLGNCSQQSNSLLRWGVNVDKVGQQTDLRITPTIWAYAKQAGYQTTLIDGQTLALQNNMWPPERDLIDVFKPMPDGISTDIKIAKELHRVLQSEQRQFVYVVLRGTHFPYENNYPASEVKITDTKEERYRKALEYSKNSFFQEMLDGLDLPDAAIFYTSDHGQVLQDDHVTHCASDPLDDEYSVPLLGIFPPHMRADYYPAPSTKFHHSHSQIFPTTLQLMGYPHERVQQSYDQPLPFETKRKIRFGRSIFPSDGEAVMNLKRD